MQIEVFKDQKSLQHLKDYTSEDQINVQTIYILGTLLCKILVLIMPQSPGDYKVPRLRNG